MKDRFNMTPAALSAAVRGDLHNAILAATPGGIEAQEAQGQRDLCQSQQRLPKTDCYKPIAREEITKHLGIKFGADADDIFVYAELPKGWAIKPTDHSMWSDLLDNKGRKRAGIFYKAAFYDRNAHISFNRRYVIQSEYRNDYRETKQFVVDAADGKRLYEGGWNDDKAASVWLAENFPDHDNCFAYWD